MNFEDLRSPVLIMGMHHSGTSLTAKLLNLAGLFMRVDMAHNECRFFSLFLHNILMMGGNWMKLPIQSVDEVMSKFPSFNECLQQQLADQLISASYDDKSFKLISAGYDGKSLWGMKDARPCVLIPLYLKLFPDAIIVHVKRDSEMVVNSLERANKPENYSNAMRLELTKQYVERVEEYGPRFNGGYHEIQYEDICLKKAEVIKPLVEALGLEFNQKVADYLREKVFDHRVSL